MPDHRKSRSKENRSSRFSRVKLSLRRIFKRLFLVAFIIASIPFLLVLVYAIPFIKPVSSLMIYQSLTGTEIQRDWVPLDEIAAPVQYAVLMSEDGQFCNHMGVDFKELKAQIQRSIEGKSARGASTISMQTVKNLYLWHGRSYTRKVFEMPLALFADTIWSKRRMMEIYLNIAELGTGIFGVEVAAQNYFKRPASALSYRQASLIATSLPSPLTRNAGKPSRRHKSHARIIEKRAKQAGDYIDCLK